MFDESIVLAENAMLRVRPELFDEWDFKKNDELGLDVYKVSYGSEKTAWWICSVCKSDYDMLIKSKTKMKKNCCPYGSGHRANHTNSLASLHPDIALQWHPTLNGDLTPHDVTAGSSQKVWWICDMGHENDALVIVKVNGHKCRYCSGHDALRGFNDMWTTNPELAKLLDDPEDGYSHTQKSDRPLDWKCPHCQTTRKNKSPKIVYNNGLGCPYCSDGKSYPEKFISQLLKELEVRFEWEKEFSWLKGRRYDFYLNDLDTIIEVHGMQHYKVGETSNWNKRENIQQVDKLKMKTAENKVKNYIVLDASESSLEHMKNSIKQSEIPKIVDIENIDWVEIEKLSLNSLLIRACGMWEGGVSTKEISHSLSVNEPTIKRYLKRGKKIGLCEYKSKEPHKSKGEVVQLSINGKYIKTWAGTSEAVKGTNSPSVYYCCGGEGRVSGGFRWMYKKDYDELKQDGNDNNI